MVTVGNYKVEKQIGEGGFGRVYQARHIHLDTLACIKQNKHDNETEVDLLKHEAQLLWSLDEHHSIPSVKDFIRLSKGSAAMVLRFIEGDTLEDTVEKNGALHPEDACWVTERLLGALYYAHFNGVVHTDIKPENVFVEPQKRDVKIIDFGMATFKPSATTVPLGYTPRYAAPELIEGKPPIPATDIYGAGVVMLRALGGDVLKKSYRSDTPEEIVKFCDTLLRYDARERPTWEKNNPLDSLSDLREKVFGRRHRSEIIKMKGGVK